MKSSLVMFKEKYAIGTVVTYHNPGKKGHGNRARIMHYLHRENSEEISYIELQFESGGFHSVPIHLLRKFYCVPDFPCKFAEMP